MTEPTIINITHPFEIRYDPKSQELTLTHDDTSEGHRRYVLKFDAERTGVLWDSLLTIAQYAGGSIGAPMSKRPTLQ